MVSTTRGLSTSDLTVGKGQPGEQLSLRFGARLTLDKTWCGGVRVTDMHWLHDWWGCHVEVRHSALLVGQLSHLSLETGNHGFSLSTNSVLPLQRLFLGTEHVLLHLQPQPLPELLVSLLQLVSLSFSPTCNILSVGC